jgi:predicted  nucleic acid-binding Zn-ribbon protein
LQAYGSLKAERDENDAQAHLHKNAAMDWQNRHAELAADHAARQELLASAISDRDVLYQDKAALRSQVDANEKVFAELQQKLTLATAALMSNKQQNQIAQADLRNANRRADEAEQTQKDLQSEGSRLMRSLDEMRPKIVELTGDKVELGNKIDSLEHALRARDAMIAELENTVEEVQNQHEEASNQREEAVTQLQREQSSAQASLAELQIAYAELQKELEEKRANLHRLETERTDHYQVTSRQLDEIDRLTVSSRTQADEVTSVRQQLEEHRHLEEEDRGFIERAQEEIEQLRADLVSADEEIHRLRNAVSSPPPDGSPKSLDAEMLSALRQQHALDLSAAQSQIRALETSVFDAQAKSHTLQRRVNILEDQLAAPSRSGSRADRPFSPSSRPSSRAHHSHQPGNLPPLSRSVFDIGLTPETRHKRRVSLSMLKARIDSELASAASHPISQAHSPALTKSRPPALSTVHEPSSQLDHSFRRPQLDDHIFWCSSCRADLIIL